MMKHFLLGLSLISTLLVSTEIAQAKTTEVTLNSLASKVDEVIKNQQDILQKLEELKTEVDVVKIRSSRV